MIYHIKALLIVIRTTLKIAKKVFTVSRKTQFTVFEIFDFCSNFELISKVVSNCNSLLKLNLRCEILVLLK